MCIDMCVDMSVDMCTVWWARYEPLMRCEWTIQGRSVPQPTTPNYLTAINTLGS